MTHADHTASSISDDYLKLKKTRTISREGSRTRKNLERERPPRFI